MEQLNQLMLVWDEVLEVMAADLPERSFDAWLKNSRPSHSKVIRCMWSCPMSLRRTGWKRAM